MLFSFPKLLFGKSVSSEDVNFDLAQHSYEINEVIMSFALESALIQKKNGLKIPTKLDQQHSKIDQHWYFFTKNKL